MTYTRKTSRNCGTGLSLQNQKIDRVDRKTNDIFALVKEIKEQMITALLNMQVGIILLEKLTDYT